MSGERDNAPAEVTPAMIEAGVTLYEKWEADHIFGDYTPASNYAIRGLVKGILQRALAVSSNRGTARNPQAPRCAA
jgi:hypothetical protein